MADEEWGKNEKKDWDEGKLKRVVLYDDRVGGAGRLLVSLPPVKVNLVVYLG